MECKCLKTNVFSTETVFNESAEQPIDIDFTLPDYYPDISKILKCRAISRIASKSTGGNAVTVEGCVTVTVIYSDSDNCLNSYEYQYPFSKSFDTGIDTSGTNLSVKTKCEYINCRAITSRKVDIHGAAGVYVTVTKRHLNEVISDVENDDIELLRGTVPATVPMGCADKYLLIDEEIEIGNGHPDVRCLIRYDAETAIKESKILAGKAVVSGEIIVKLLYSAENGGVHTVRSSTPFSQLIEIDGIGNECECESKVYIAHLEVKPRTSASGECRSFILNAKLLVTAECCCNNDIAVILDAYSKKYEANICKNEVCFDNICENINENFTCKQSVEFAAGSIASVCDMWCESRIDNVRFADGKMTVCGVVYTYIIALDEDGSPQFYEKTFDFEHSHIVTSNCQSLKCSPEISVCSASYTLTSNGMEIRAEMCISASVYESNKIPLIVEIKIDEQKSASGNSCGAMTLYFASCGESIWDIARKYFADVDEVKQINGINENVLNCDCMIMIPTN